MKIEQLLVQHFYKHREVTLQGLGTFTLSPDFVLPQENDKDAEIPDNAISFQYNSRAAEDEALISYIVQQTRKMRPLAAADLDSYLVLGKQFLNIGKPFKIEGLGMLMKNQQGEYQFTQGHSFQSKAEEIPTALKEKLNEDDISFTPVDKSLVVKRTVRITLGIIIGIGIIAATAWYFLRPKSNTPVQEQTAEVKPVTKPDTNKILPVIDSAVNDAKKDSSVPAAVNKDYTFKVVFRVMSRSGAEKKMIELNKPWVVMYTTDSIKYKLAEKYTLPLSDTTRIKDSLRKFYDFRTFIELK